MMTSLFSKTIDSIRDKSCLLYSQNRCYVILSEDGAKLQHIPHNAKKNNENVISECFKEGQRTGMKRTDMPKAIDKTNKTTKTSWKPVPKHIIAECGTGSSQLLV